MKINRFYSIYTCILLMVSTWFNYIFLLYKVVIWYMNIEAPTMEQSGLVSIVVGAGAAWFGLYTGSRAKGK